MSDAETEARAVRCAVRGPETESERTVLEAYLDGRGLSEAVRFLPRDNDDLDAELCAGRFERVIFPNLEALLTAMWEGHARLDRWRARGVRIEIADGGGGDLNHHLESVLLMYESLTRWRARRRRRQVVAAILLSLVALAAMGVLLFVVPPAG